MHVLKIEYLLDSLKFVHEDIGYSDEEILDFATVILAKQSGYKFPTNTELELARCEFGVEVSKWKSSPTKK